MKKLRYLLSAFLLVAGLGTASAQYYAVDDEADQTDPELVKDGAQVAFYSCGNGTDGANGGYLNGTANLKSELTSDCIYTIEATGRDAENGEPLYLLKQNTTGKYIRQSQLENYAVGGLTTEYLLTDTLELAMGFTIMTNWPIELEGMPEDMRTISSDGKQDLDDYAWVICSEYVLNQWEDDNYVKHDTAIYTYLGAVSGPMLSTWYDTNCWWIYPATEATGEDLIYAAFQDIAANCAPGGLTAGIDPGCYGSAEIAAYSEVYAEVEEQLNAYTYDDAQASDLVARLKAAKEALDASFVNFEGGKYYMFASNAAYGAGMYLYWNGSAWVFGTPADVNTVSVADAAYYFFVENAGEDEDGVKLYNIKNYESGNYITSNYNSNAIIPGGATAVLQINAQPNGEVVGAFNIIDTDEDAVYEGVYHHQQAGHKLVTWNAPNAKACLFTIKSVPTAAVEALEEAIKQVKRNADLTEVVADANALLGASKVYKPSAECTLDGKLDNMGLVTDINRLSTNCQEPTEGPIASLLDNDVTTFFHSAWSVSAPANRYIDANLGEAVDGLSLKLARRVHGNQAPAPVMFDVFASTDSTTWVEQGALAVKYDYDHVVPAHDTIVATYPDSVITRTGYVGVGALAFDGSYQYVRLEVPAEYTQGGSSNFFYMSELRYYAGAAYDAATSPYEQSPADLRAAFEQALATAEAELAAEAATQATIDALQAAYDALLPTVPSTAELHSLIDQYTTLLENATEGDGIGFFETGSKEVFQAVVDNIANTMEETWNVTQIAAAKAELVAAYATFMEAYQVPEAGVLYAIRIMSRKQDSGATINKVGNFLTSKSKGQAAYCYGNNNGAFGTEFSEANDTIDITTAYSSLWIFDYPVEGHIDTVTIRNAATGLYLGTNGTMVEEPFKIGMQKFAVANETVWGNNNFLFEIGGTYVNIKFDLTATSWHDANDVNSAFRVEAVDAAGIMLHTLKNLEPAVLCLPYTISDYQWQGTFLQPAGIRTEGTKTYMVFEDLATENGAIVAGTPFVFWPNEAEFEESLDVEFELADSLSGDPTIIPQFSTTVKSAFGLVGTFQATEIAANVGKIRDGAIYVEKAKSLLSAYSGVIVEEAYEEVAASTYELELIGTLVGIDNVVAEGAKSGDVYSIDGRYVGKSVKALPAGIYVIDGKKVLVK